MAEEKRAPEQDASEGDRATIERELKRNAENDKGSGSSKKPDTTGDGTRGNEKVAIATPVEPGDQNAQTMPPSM
jgi:hypothetical protein